MSAVLTAAMPQCSPECMTLEFCGLCVLCCFYVSDKMFVVLLRNKYIIQCKENQHIVVKQFVKYELDCSMS